MNRHHKINYLEIPSRDIVKTKAFFSRVFGWEFVDYGPQYCSFTKAGMDGGFFQSELVTSTANGAPLVVLYSAELEATAQSVVAAGGNIIRPTFSFPGGRRFHFSDPNGNEYAVWSE